MEGEAPPALIAKPELWPHQQTMLDAFYLLCPDRPIGGMGGVGAIPTLAIYAAANEIGEEPQVFLALCRSLDALYMDHVNTRKK